MAKSNGIKSLKQAAKLLNKHAPEGESLAYINPDEGRLLKAHGGSGIMTVAGVPSYISLFGVDIPGTDWLPWETGTDVLKAFNPYKNPTGPDDEPLYNPKTGEPIRGRSIVQDAFSVWAFLRAKKDAEGLNNAEMEQFNKLNRDMTASQEQFKGYIDEGKQLTAPEYVTTPKAVFSETTGRPDMITTPIATPAEGGRIGYQEGTHPLDGAAMQMFGVTFENLNPLQQIVVTQSQQKAGWKDKLEERLNLPPYDSTEDVEKMYKYMSAHGGRIGAQGGGIMPLLNMGGMEKDYRQDGGFVPIGRKEKADDVPARLSKNEFVFTADAVRAAGGGDIDQGAQRMYNVMKNLEAGGDISEQSQGKA